tara:strand:- start:1461 stop:2504 length:1044 start_codon:yes stop_codon:yes gene_type:complete
MKKYFKVLLVFAVVSILATSVVSAGFWDITGFSIFDKIRERMGGGQTGPEIGEPEIAVNCEDSLDICQASRDGCRDDLDDCEMDLSGSEETLALCESNLQACQLEECEEIVCEECEDCEECRRTYCIGDWDMDAGVVDGYKDFVVANPKVNGNSDEVVIEYEKCLSCSYNHSGEFLLDTYRLNLEIDENLDINHIVAGETSANTVYITSDTQEGIHLDDSISKIDVGFDVVTNEIWLWYNDGDATIFGGDPSENYITVFYKNQDNNQVEWFSSSPIAGTLKLFTWFDAEGNYLSGSNYVDYDSNTVTIGFGSGYHILEMHWGIDNGDFAFLGDTENTEEACELELNP